MRNLIFGILLGAAVMGGVSWAEQLEMELGTYTAPGRMCTLTAPFTHPEMFESTFVARRYTDDDIAIILNRLNMIDQTQSVVNNSMSMIAKRLVAIEKRLDTLTSHTPTPTGLLAQGPSIPPIPPIPPITMPPIGTSSCKQLYLCDANGNCRYETVCR